MSAINELQENLEAMRTARFVTTMLRDISATKLQTIRDEFDKNAAFYAEMRELDALVQKYGLHHGSLSEAELESRGGTIYVALTSNKRFYGTINKDVMEKLIRIMKEDSGDAYLVIGQTGRQYLKNSEHEDRCKYLEFADDDPTAEESLSLMKRLSNYGQVFMLHPGFINAFRQEVAVADITHRPELEEAAEVEVDYIFEPDIVELVEFFETQVRLILFNRVLLETKLAQTGARLSKMERARERAGELVKEQRHTIHKEETSLQSMRLLETFAGFQKK